ncbi:hypothetical protein PLICRDRAFT_53943 [Plicaturopsis crispa FD-325 SS-3]|nr:hypothetical protein PLICRDRAFT_53943 [Plicaturopsis crispa FD-325 SS-3]
MSTDKHAEDLATIGELEFELSQLHAMFERLQQPPRPPRQQLEDAMVKLRVRLLRRRYQVRKTMRRLHARYADHTMSLPDEILAEIFMHGPPEWSLGSLPFQVTVSHVSRRWRAVALQFPQLWSRIHLADLQEAEGPKYHKELLLAHIARSAECSLSIVWRGLVRNNLDFAKLTALAHRWTSFTGHGQLAHYAYHLADWSAPNLRHFAIIDKKTSRHASHSYVLFEDGLPDLSSLVLDGFGCLRFYQQNPLRSLKHLCISDQEPDSNTLEGSIVGVLGILATARSLTTFSLRCALGSNGQLFPFPTTPIDLPLLTHLSLHISDPYCSEQQQHYLSPILIALTAPSLAHLTIREARYSDVLHLGRTLLDNDPAGRYPSLRTLSLEVCFAPLANLHQDDDVHDPRFKDLFKLLMLGLPSIRDATIIAEYRMLLVLLEDATPTADDGYAALWPSLQTLTVENPFGWMRDHEGMVLHPSAVLQSRIAAGSRLTNLTMKMHHLYFPEHQSIEDLRQHVHLELVDTSTNFETELVPSEL